MTLLGRVSSIILSFRPGLCTILWILLLVCCSPKVNHIETPFTNSQNFSKSGTAVIPDKWWTVFGEDQLNNVIERALSNNLELIAVWNQLQASKAILKMESSFLLPDIEAGAQTAISRPEPDFAGGENTQIGASAEYEVDLWGRISAGVKAEEFRLQASYYDYQAAAITLSAEIALIWFQMLNTQKHLQLTEKQMTNNENIIKLIQVRFGRGDVKGVDILRQRQLLEQTRNEKIFYETNLQLLKNQMAVLTGDQAQNFEMEVINNFPDMPPQPGAGVPLELIRRRPDIQREYNALLAADRDMAVAVANKFPRLSLDFSTQARSNTYNELFSNWAYTIGGNLVAPLLYWGRLRAAEDRAAAMKEQQLYWYGQSVLTAFKEVEDALIEEKNQIKRVEILENRLEMANKISRQLQVEFANGMTDYLDVLISVDEQQQLQNEILNEKLKQFEIRIALYRALAGGFETDREPQINFNDSTLSNIQ